MVGELDNKKFPSVTIQSVLLGTNFLLFESNHPDIYFILSIIILLGLFFLQAINHRFYYFFPFNKFSGTTTPHADTVILYILVLVAFVFTLLGITASIIFTSVATVAIILPPFLWRLFIYPIVRGKITLQLKKRSYKFDTQCRKCGNIASLERRIKEWNEGEETTTCQACNSTITRSIPLNIG